jgi:hypothetical protein
MLKLALKRVLPCLIPSVVLVIAFFAKPHGALEGPGIYIGSGIFWVMAGTALVFLMEPGLAGVFVHHPVNGGVGLSTTANHQGLLYGGDLSGTRFRGMATAATYNFEVPLSYSGSSTSFCHCMLVQKTKK